MFFRWLAATRNAAAASDPRFGAWSNPTGELRRLAAARIDDADTITAVDHCARPLTIRVAGVLSLVVGGDPGWTATQRFPDAWLAV